MYILSIIFYYSLYFLLIFFTKKTFGRMLCERMFNEVKYELKFYNLFNSDSAYHYVNSMPMLKLDYFLII